MTKKKESHSTIEGEQIQSLRKFIRTSTVDSGKTEHEKRRARLTQVAHFLLLIGAESAANILKHLTQEEVEAISAEMIATKRIAKDEAEELFAIFQKVNMQKPRLRGGREAAREVLELSFGRERANEILYRIFPEQIKEYCSFLSAYTPEQIYFYMRDESIQVSSLLLFCLSPREAAKLLALYPLEMQLEIVKRITTLQSINEEVVEQLASRLQKKLSSNKALTSVKVDGLGRLADILKHSNTGIGELILADIGREMPEVEEHLRDRMFSIDVLFDIPDRQLQELLQDVEDRTLACIMQGVEEKIVQRILSNISARRQQRLAYEVQLLETVSPAEIERLIHNFVMYIKKCSEEGSVVFQHEIFDNKTGKN